MPHWSWQTGANRYPHVIEHLQQALRNLWAISSILQQFPTFGVGDDLQLGIKKFRSSLQKELCAAGRYGGQLRTAGLALSWALCATAVPAGSSSR